MKPASRFPSFTFALAGVAAISFLGVSPRLHAADDKATPPAGRPAVNVVLAHPAQGGSELRLPASLQPFQEASIYARTDGYLASWLVDIGDRVKAGQTLATIDAPELDQQLNQARAALEQAQANSELARTSAVRWKDLSAKKAVAQQEVDEKQSALVAREADVHAAEANVSRLVQLKQYQTIVAPFDGVISARNVDIGALISAGGSGRELFRIAQTNTLRVYVAIPQTYVRSIRPGLSVDVTVAEFPTTIFKGKVTRVSGALDPTTRTLQTEVQIPNEKGELLAGMFGQVRLNLEAAEPPLVVPSGAIVTRGDGDWLYVVTPDNLVHLQKIRLGRDFGTDVEILSGLKSNDKVVTTPSDAIADGLNVDPVVLAPAKKS